MRKLYEICKLLSIQKRIVAAATIWGNTVLVFNETVINRAQGPVVAIAKNICRLNCQINM